MTPLERKFPGGGGSNRKNHPWGGYGYFLELHNINTVSVFFLNLPFDFFVLFLDFRF